MLIIISKMKCGSLEPTVVLISQYVSLQWLKFYQVPLNQKSMLSFNPEWPNNNLSWQFRKISDKNMMSKKKNINMENDYVI